MKVFATAPDILCNTCLYAKEQEVFFYCEKIKQNTFGRTKCGYYDGDESPIDIVIITATDLETAAVKNFMEVCEPWSTVNYEGIWLKSETQNSDGERIRILLAQSYIMGLPAAAVLATKSWFLHRPKYMIMLGVLAGNPNKTNIGDVIIPRFIYDYGAGKWKENEFMPNSTPCSLDIETLENCKQLADDEEFIKRLGKGSPKLDSDFHPRVITGGISVSGASVISRRDIWDFICKQQKEAISLDMESFAIVYSAMQIRGEFPKVLIAKSVCDHAFEKTDDGQPIAAYTSVKFVEEYIKRFVTPAAELSTN